ncbi:DUF1365 domain-containing protein [Breoghania sp. L-A4]|uniref:DUF1365 domain-containing protein n=1 Tax=Breoghania sp. L-A4 TaxID=2304600 RepID=UPI000E35DD4B|nr:DUF1365 domain-containing protein [Breoghania sp. L-A4]AXS41503.1 DUF1365 domain-containing protein [Breoghania sp. L-A4]
MTAEALYSGTVVHTRLRPCVHTLRYSVFALLFDCDRIDALGGRLRLFSYNRFNLFSLYDRDHGDGTPLRAYLHGLAAQSGHGGDVRRFAMLCYPRILGYAFNPLTVYFGLDAEGDPRLVVYEVNNTFGERKTYVIPVAAGEKSLIFQRCRKELHVSPFNPPVGSYSFRVTPPAETITVGVALRDTSGPVLKTHFRAHRDALSDRSLLRALARTGWMTIKVMIGIHYEAARLWFKGLRLVPRPPAPETPVTFAKTPREGS